jgi:hypothetical protein
VNQSAALVRVSNFSHARSSRWDNKDGTVNQSAALTRISNSSQTRSSRWENKDGTVNQSAARKRVPAHSAIGNATAGTTCWNQSCNSEWNREGHGFSGVPALEALHQFLLFSFLSATRTVHQHRPHTKGMVQHN